jgi:hypothetical protein
MGLNTVKTTQGAYYVLQNKESMLRTVENYLRIQQIRDLTDADLRYFGFNG